MREGGRQGEEVGALLGLLWIVVFYITAGAFPVAAFGYWNLVAGFGLLIAGFAMTMRWR